MATKYVDYLTEDKPIAGQLWVCISFLSPEGIRNCSVRGLKIRGVFGTRQEADERAKELQTIDADHNVFVGEVGKWLPWDPDVNECDQVYQEKELNELAKGYKENMAKSSEFERQRKADMLEKSAREEQVKSMKPVDRKRLELQNKLAAKKKGDNKVENLVEKDFKGEAAKISEESVGLKKAQSEISEKEKVVSSYDEKLSKIQELYNKMNAGQK